MTHPDPTPARSARHGRARPTPPVLRIGPRLALRALVLAGLALLAACGAADPRLQPLAPGAAVLALGDSLTAGTGAGPGQDYPARLAALTGLSVINAGVPGETSDAALARLPALLARHAPALVLLCSGGNDILRRVAPERTVAHLEAMVAASHASGAQVLLIAVPQPGLRLRAAPFYAALGQRLAVPVEMQALAQILSDPALKDDPIHPNAAGYARLAATIAARLRESGALPPA